MLIQVGFFVLCQCCLYVDDIIQVGEDIGEGYFYFLRWFVWRFGQIYDVVYGLDYNVIFCLMCIGFGLVKFGYGIIDELWKLLGQVGVIQFVFFQFFDFEIFDENVC